MNYRLGIDLGTSSLGWCCLKTENGEIKGILDMGVRIFPDGRNDKSKEPLCVARRNARSSRKRLKRFKLRQKQLILDLQEVGLFPTEKKLRKELEQKNPYELRAKALHQKLNLYEIGRVIFHLNQRRGFLSNRKEEKNAQFSNTKTQQAMNKLAELIEQNNCLTLGEYMYKTKTYRFKNATDAQGKLIINIYPDRKMYEDEFNAIWNYQKMHYPNILTDERKKRFRDFDIFYQRPLKKQDTGFCSLELNEYRSPKAYSAAQEFRIRSEMANLAIIYPVERALTKEEYELLFDFLNRPQAQNYDDDYTVSFEKIIKYLQLPEETIFNLMKNNRKGIKCNITNAILGRADTFADSWYNLPDEMQRNIIDILQNENLYNDDIKCFLTTFNPNMSEQTVRKILEQSLLLPDGYANLSALAMHKLSEDMKLCGTDYITSVKNVYHKTPAEIAAFPQLEYLPKYQELFHEQLIGGDKEKYQKQWDYDNYMGRITNVSVHIALNQLRNVVNELIQKYGKPEGITIELGRELTKGKKALAEIEKKQKENAAIMAEARAEIRKAGLPVTSFNIEKYKVWYNLNPKDVTKRVDLYTGKTISITDLFGREYEIEHILPYSWSYDDSYNNKIITRYDINRKKSNQLPFEFFSDMSQLSVLAKNKDELDEMSLAKIKERAKDIDKAHKNIKKTFNFKAVGWRFSPNARNIFNKNNKNMARDLTDMQYMSKLAKKYLTCICAESKIVSAKGQITDQLKKVWNIADTLPKDYELWTVQKWQQDILIDKKEKELRENNPESDDKTITRQAKEIVNALSTDEIHNKTSVLKDRSIHYHHALDAFTLANITPEIIQFISGNDFADQTEQYQTEANQKAENGQFITLGEARTKLLKESGKFYSRPYPLFDKEDFIKQLNRLTVSYKEPKDKLKNIIQKATALHKNISSFGFAPINKDSAFGFRRILSVKKDDIEIEFAERKSGKRVFEKKSLSCMVPVFRTKEQKVEFHQKYTEWLKASVRKKVIGENKYQKIETDFINTFTKDKAFKWHESAGNYAAQIYQINKNDKFLPNKEENWSLEILSNYYAFERRGKFFWKDVHPTAKRITTIRNNNIIEAAFSADDTLETGFSGIRKWVQDQFRKYPEKKELKLLFRVKKMSGGSIFLRPLHIAQEDGDTKSWQCSIGKFKQYHCRKVSISAIGHIGEK